MREMKDSGIEWIGEIPADWNLKKLKHTFTISSGTTPKSDNLEYWDGDIPWVTPADYKTEDKYVYHGRKFLSEAGLNATNLQLLPVNSIIFSKRAPIGAVAITGAKLAINQGCISCVPAIECDIRYYYFILSIYTEQFNLLGSGTTFKEISSKDFGNFTVPAPSVSVQEKLADYLDRKCSQIDAIIARQQEVIEKLKAYKLSVITEAVTKGLNPNVPMKDSGVEWIGEIPVHWTIGQLKHYASLRAGLTLGKKYPPNSKLVEVPYLRVANVQGDYVKLDDIADVSVLPEEIEKYSLHKNELLMTEGGDRDKLGRGCIWNGEIQPCLHQNHVFAVTTDTSKLRIEFLNYVTSSNVARVYFDYTAKKTTNLASTNSTVILQFKLPIPPIKEQDSVVSYLETKCTEIDRCLSNTELIISKLQNYKKSLIYEIVTGKKEV